MNGSLGEDERNDRAPTSGWELGLAVFRLFIARFFKVARKVLSELPISFCPSFVD